MSRMREVGLIMPPGAVAGMDSFLTESIKHLTNSFLASGFDLLLFNDAKLEFSELDCLRPGSPIEGIVLFSPSKADSEKLEKLENTGIPCVIIFSRYDGIDSFTCANDAGGYIATKYLLQKGRKKIAFVQGDPGWLDSSDRYSGFKKALLEFGAEFRPEFVVSGYNQYAKAKAVISIMLSQGGRPDAVFAANDHMAMGVLSAVKDKGLAVPFDVSVIGFDNIPGTEDYEPPLTTLAQPIKNIVESAAQRLIAKIEGKTDGKPILELFKPVLIERESV